MALVAHLRCGTTVTWLVQTERLNQLRNWAAFSDDGATPNIDLLLPTVSTPRDLAAAMSALLAAIVPGFGAGLTALPAARLACNDALVSDDTPLIPGGFALRP